MINRYIMAMILAVSALCACTDTESGAVSSTLDIPDATFETQESLPLDSTTTALDTPSDPSDVEPQVDCEPPEDVGEIACQDFHDCPQGEEWSCCNEELDKDYSDNTLFISHWECILGVCEKTLILIEGCRDLTCTTLGCLAEPVEPDGSCSEGASCSDGKECNDDACLDGF